MDLHSTVVFNEAQLPKFVHENVPAADPLNRLAYISPRPGIGECAWPSIHALRIRSTPLLSEHTDGVLREVLHYSDKEIGGIKASGAISATLDKKAEAGRQETQGRYLPRVLSFTGSRRSARRCSKR